MNNLKFQYFLLIFLSEQKIDGLCLKEGLTESELTECEVRTVGDKKLVKRKIEELVGKI